MWRLVPIVLALLLAGCASDQSLKDQAAADDDAACQAHGYKLDSPDYEQCRQALDAQRTKNERAALMKRLQGVSPMQN